MEYPTLPKSQTKSFHAKLLVYYWSVSSTVTILSITFRSMSSTAGHGTDTGGAMSPAIE